MTHCRLHTPRRGTVGVAIIVALVVVQVIVVTVVIAGARDQDLMIKRLDSLRAFYASEAGMNMAIREMRLGLDEDGDGTIGRISDDGNPSNDPTFGSASVMVTSTFAGMRAKLTSDGRSRDAMRRIEAYLDTAGGMGLTGEYFLGPAPLPATKLSEIDWSVPPAYTAVVSLLNMPLSYGEGWPGGPIPNWGKQFTGKILIPAAGIWTFYTTSDDGSRLWIDGTLVVDNDGVHPFITASGTISLTSGAHDFQVQWFETAGVYGLIAEWQGPTVPTQTVIPSSVFVR